MTHKVTRPVHVAFLMTDNFYCWSVTINTIRKVLSTSKSSFKLIQFEEFVKSASLFTRSESVRIVERSIGGILYLYETRSRPRPSLSATVGGPWNQFYSLSLTSNLLALWCRSMITRVYRLVFTKSYGESSLSYRSIWNNMLFIKVNNSYDLLISN